jgi:toxin-antitoxin system PIN domain toxin
VTTYLLDDNVLIALTVSEHVHHARASAWAGTIDRFAVCPVVEGALVRFLVRAGERAAAAQQVVRALADRPGYDFWPDSLSYAETDLAGVLGHRQVTDAYLVGLAGEHRRGLLATLDESLARNSPDWTLLIPDPASSD